MWWKWTPTQRNEQSSVFILNTALLENLCRNESTLRSGAQQYLFKTNLWHRSVIVSLTELMGCQRLKFFCLFIRKSFRIARLVTEPQKYFPNKHLNESLFLLRVCEGVLTSHENNSLSGFFCYIWRPVCLFLYQDFGWNRPWNPLAVRCVRAPELLALSTALQLTTWSSLTQNAIVSQRNTDPNTTSTWG